MLVGELIEALSEFDPETEVMFSYDYGDYCHKQECDGIENVDLCKLEWSDYMQAFQLLTDENGYPIEEYDDEKHYSKRKEAVVLR